MNPILTEIQGLSPAAKGALGMAGHTLPTPEALAAAGTPSVIPPGMLLPHADTGPPPGPISMPSPAPMTMPQSSPQLVTGPKRGQAMTTDGQLAPMGTTMGDQAERSRLLSEGSGISQIGGKIENSRLGQAHPLVGKLLGSLAQGAATIGDVGLSAVAPEIAINTPGTAYHHDMLLNHADRAVNQDVTNAGKEAQAANENATAQHTEAETPEVAPNAASTRALQGAETAHAEAETTALGSPSLVVHDTEEGPILVNPKTGSAQRVTVDGQPVGSKLNLKESQPVMGADGKPHTYMLDDKGNKVVDLGVHYERPITPPGVTMIVPNGQGGGTVERLAPGQTVAPGAQTAAGVNAVNTPTMTQRTAAGRAETVVAMAPEVLGRIDSLAPKMGPLEGRWNEFMQGKIGANDPDFAALRSDLLMMSSAVALAHAQGRLPENLREEFDRAINAPKQTPQNLKATINAMLPWLEKMQQQGKPNEPEAQPTGNVIVVKPEDMH